MAQSLQDLTGSVAALFTDLDGTMTEGGRVHAQTLVALEELVLVGIPVVLVTGRSAGWGQALMSLLPFAAVVTENGGVTFAPRGVGVDKIYGVDPSTLPTWRNTMDGAVAAVRAQFPEVTLSADSPYREVDLALDWNEDAKWPVDKADQMVGILRQHGLAASRSSVHVNFAPPSFDKLSACRLVVERVLRGDPDDLGNYVYVGDSSNDVPAFAGFPRSVGVGNVRTVWHQLASKPAFVVDDNEGAGLRAVVRHVLGLVNAGQSL